MARGGGFASVFAACALLLPLPRLAVDFQFT